MTAYGNSAAREAARIRARARRGLWRRFTAAVGMNPAAVRADAQAARWDRGAAAEEETARMLHTLHTRGWHILNDRALPGSRANLDHVLVSPCGTAVVVLDTKRWHAQKPTWLVRGRVHCGTEDRHGQIEAVAGYAGRVAKLVGVDARSVWPLLVVHGSRVAGGRLEARVAGWPGPVWVLSPPYLVPTLAAAPQVRDPQRAGAVAVRVDRVLRPYGEGG